MCRASCYKEKILLVVIRESTVPFRDIQRLSTMPRGPIGQQDSRYLLGIYRLDLKSVPQDPLLFDKPINFQK
jgi:hypothetical protein